MILCRRQTEEINSKDIIYVKDYRKYQYDIIPKFGKLFIDYLNQQYGGNYLTFKNVKIEEASCYFSQFTSQLTNMDINIINQNGEEKTFIRMLLPTLIEDNLFFLNGNYYCPAMYVIDYPIIIKKESIKLYAIFNSITLYMKDDIVIFTGSNIPMSYFFYLLFKDDKEGEDLSKEILLKYGKEYIKPSDDDLIAYFDNKFQFKGKDLDQIINFLERVFFDAYTKKLYEKCYDIENIDLRKIVKKSLQLYLYNEPPNFVDLSQKRIVFLEMIFRPLIERISNLVKRIWYGFKIDEIKVDQLNIVKYFLTSPDPTQKRKGLAGNYLYDTVNIYTGILQNKISMVPPGIENAPKSVQTIHPTHYNRICPISISSQKPGHVVSVIPNIHIDKFGRFI